MVLVEKQFSHLQLRFPSCCDTLPRSKLGLQSCQHHLHSHWSQPGWLNFRRRQSLPCSGKGFKVATSFAGMVSTLMVGSWHNLKYASLLMGWMALWLRSESYSALMADCHRFMSRRTSSRLTDLVTKHSGLLSSSSFASWHSRYSNRSRSSCSLQMEVT